MATLLVTYLEISHWHVRYFYGGITNDRQYSRDLPQGGLEIPCKLHFKGPRICDDPLKRLAQNAEKVITRTLSRPATETSKLFMRKKEVLPKRPRCLPRLRMTTLTPYLARKRSSLRSNQAVFFCLSFTERDAIVNGDNCPVSILITRSAF